MATAFGIQQRLQKAQALAQANRFGEAWSLVMPMREAIDHESGALRLYTWIADRSGKLDEAASALRRIAELERNPPEIVGALADTLGKLGRHSEAADEWQRLVGMRPELADAHLNFSVSALNAGEGQRALDAAEDGLRRFPSHARLLASRASALKNLGRLEEALTAFDAALAADPGRPRVHYNRAVTLRAICRYDEACEAFAEAERLGESRAGFYSDWAAATLEADRVDEAEMLYRRALALDPRHREAREAMTRLELEYRSGEKAFDHYAELAQRSGQQGDWDDWIYALVANDRHAEAAEIGRRAMDRFGADSSSALATYFSEGMIGDAGRALAAVDALPSDIASSDVGLLAQAHLALRAHRFERAAAAAERYNVGRDQDQSGWSLLSVIWRMLEDPREQWLCDYDRYVMVADVSSPDGKIPPDAFAARIAETLDPLHRTIHAPGNQSLRNGTQTSGALFDRPDPDLQLFRQAIAGTAGEAVGRLPRDPKHPFLSRISAGVTFAGSWSVRLAGGGGHHVPHFHAFGWMSSAYYARLPSTVAGAENHEGSIEFGRPPAMFDLDIGPRRIVDPAVGQLVLFPSFMWHGTIPFPAGGDTRLTAAFDFLPA